MRLVGPSATKHLLFSAELIEAAKKEGELTWYTVPQTSEVAEKMGRSFSARYPGVKVSTTS